MGKFEALCEFAEECNKELEQTHLVGRIATTTIHSYMDSGDFEFESKEEEEDWNKRGEFWDAVFEKYKTTIPANMGLTYEFFRHDDI